MTDVLAVLRQPVGQRRAGRAGADDDEVRLKHRSTCFMKSASETLPPVAMTSTVLPATSTPPSSRAASEAAPEGSSTSFRRSKAIFIAVRTAASVTVTPRTPAALHRGEGRDARSPRHQPVADRRLAPSGTVSIAPCASEAPMPLKPSGSTPIDLGCGRQIVEGERDAADQPAAADGAEQQIGLRALVAELVERLQPGAGLAGDDLRIVERVQQDQAFLLGDLARARSAWPLPRGRARHGRSAPRGRRSRRSRRAWRRARRSA